tara:strand:- start:729 stop:1859 length:1131 start_codon:yes stop_codon:yes gene_type:complete
MKALILVCLFSIGLIGCNEHKNHSKGGSDEQTVKSEKYICPMHPQITSDKPGQQCSICGMDLVLAEDDEEEEGSETDHSHDHTHENGSEESSQMTMTEPTGRAGISLSLGKQQTIGVKTDAAKLMTLTETIRAPGRIAFDPELYTAQSEYLEALRQKRRVKNSPLGEIRRSTNEMVRSARTRLKVLGLGDEEIKSLAKKGQVSDGLIISGKKDNLIYADVFESDLSKIKSGQKVNISASFIKGEPLKGEVVSVDQVIDPKTRTGKARIKIQKTDFSIRPESFVTVDILVPLGKHIAIPIEAVLDTGVDLFVFVKKGKGKFEPRKILKSFETDNYVAVYEGLKEDEVVVTSANFLIDSESRLKSVIKGTGTKHGRNH